MTTVAETLRTAANLLEERGWHRIGLGMTNGSGPLSLMGALAEASGVDETEDQVSPAYQRAYSAVADHLWLSEQSEVTLGLWNVCPGRTEGDAITLLRATALAESIKAA